MTILNDLTVTSGTLDVAGDQLNVGHNLSVANGATLRVGGTNNFPAVTGTATFGSTSTVEYYFPGGPQTVAAANYGGLTISGARTTNSVTLAGAGSIGIAGTFNPSTTFSSGGFVVTGSTVDFNGTGAQTIPAFNYNNLTSSSTGARTLAAAARSASPARSRPGTNTYTDHRQHGQLQRDRRPDDPGLQLQQPDEQLDRRPDPRRQRHHRRGGDVHARHERLHRHRQHGRLQRHRRPDDPGLHLQQPDPERQRQQDLGRAPPAWPATSASTARPSSRHSSTLTFTGSAATQTIGGTVSGTIPFSGLTVNKSSGGLTLAKNVSVAGVLTLTQGIVTTGLNTLTANGTVSGASSAELRQRPPPEAGRHRPLQPAVRDRDRGDLCPGQPGDHRRQRGRQPDRVLDRERPSPAGQLGHRPRQHHRPLLDPDRGRRPDRHELQRDVHLRQPR